MHAPFPDLELVSITKRFGHFTALEAISLKVTHGEFLAIIGPSGCGKTTLLRILAGLDGASYGQVHVRGHDISRLPVHQRPTRMVWQNYALFPHLDVAGNISFGLTLKPHDKSTVAAKVKAVAETVGLEDLLHRRIHHLSGGQKQRVALARALVTEPAMLLLDEPLSALDAHLRLRVQNELRNIQRRLGMTFIYVTHNQTEALSMADRVVVMNGGRVEQIGTPEEIYAHPRTEFVARFVGMNNLIPGYVRRAEGGHVLVECGSTHVQVRTDKRPILGSSVYVAVQADRISTHRAENALRATLSDREYCGSHSIYRLGLDDGSEIKMMSSAPVQAGVNETVNAFFSAGDATLIERPA